MISIKKLRANYQLRFPFEKRLHDFIKSLPKDQQKTKMDLIKNSDGTTKEDWYRVINEAGLIKIIIYLKQNNTKFNFENLTQDELNYLVKVYKEKINKILETEKAKIAGLDIKNVDWSFIKIQPYDYQKEAVLFSEKAKQVIIGDEMGIGKTLTGITLASKLHLKTLVICPASLKLNWRNEIHKFSNEKSFIFKYKPKRKSTEVIYTKEESLFHIINYESLETYIKLNISHKCTFTDCGWIEMSTKKSYKECPSCKRQKSIRSRYNNLEFVKDKNGVELNPKDYRLIILDESHFLKESKTLRYKIVKNAFKDIEYKLLLSGTAIKNRPYEFFTSLNFIDPNEWKSAHEFGVKYCGGHQNNFGWQYDGATNLEELYKRISPYFLRRLKKDVLPFLPPKTYTNIPIELSDEEYREYKKIEKGVVDESNEGDNDATFLVRLQKMMQYTAKVKVLPAIEIIQNIIDGDEKVVVFFHHVAPAKLLYEHFKKNAVILTGENNMNERQDSVDKFMNNKDVKVFIGTIGAAGVGITLTSASIALFCEKDLVPGNILQAEDRIHRATTTSNKVQIISMVCQDTIDEDIESTLKEKQEIVSRVLDGRVIDKKVEKFEGSVLKDLIKVILNKKIIE